MIFSPVTDALDLQAFMASPESKADSFYGLTLRERLERRQNAGGPNSNGTSSKRPADHVSSSSSAAAANASEGDRANEWGQ